MTAGLKDPSRNLFVFVIWAKARKFEPQIREALAREFKIVQDSSPFYSLIFSGFEADDLLIFSGFHVFNSLIFSGFVLRIDALI